jgi:hypothetical protein
VVQVWLHRVVAAFYAPVRIFSTNSSIKDGHAAVAPTLAQIRVSGNSGRTIFVVIAQIIVDCAAKIEKLLAMSSQAHCRAERLNEGSCQSPRVLRHRFRASACEECLPMSESLGRQVRFRVERDQQIPQLGRDLQLCRSARRVRF